jgi:hypothetical protein
MNRRQTKFERFLNQGTKIIRKLGEMAKASLWIEKVYRNEMVREVFKIITSWLL